VEEAFDTSEDSAEAAAKARNAARDSMLLQAPLRRVNSPAHRPVTLRIRNLSAGGMMAECSEPIATAEQVVMDLRGVGEVTGTVAWCHDGRVGISFDTPIDPRLTRKPIAAPKRVVTPSYLARRPGLKIN
jgi:hypothetical protein